MPAYHRTHGAAKGWAIFCGLLFLASADAKVTVVTLSQLVDESDTIVYGSFQLTSRANAQSSSYVPFTPKSVLRGKDLSVNGSITFCNFSGEKAPDLSKMKGTLLIFATKQTECFGLSHGNKSIVRVKAGRARTAAMDDQPEAQPLSSLLKKIRALVAKQPAA
jgi:hypothetical protein